MMSVLPAAAQHLTPPALAAADYGAVDVQSPVTTRWVVGVLLLV